MKKTPKWKMVLKSQTPLSAVTSRSPALVKGDEPRGGVVKSIHCIKEDLLLIPNTYDSSFYNSNASSRSTRIHVQADREADRQTQTGRMF